MFRHHVLGEYVSHEQIYQPCIRQAKYRNIMLTSTIASGKDTNNKDTCWYGMV